MFVSLITDDLSANIFHFKPLRLCKLLVLSGDAAVLNEVLELFKTGDVLRVCKVEDVVEQDLLLPRRRDGVNNDADDSLLVDTAVAGGDRDMFIEIVLQFPFIFQLISQ